MRRDMHKVLVEEPRVGSRRRNPDIVRLRRQRPVLGEDRELLDDEPASRRQGMRPRTWSDRKEFGDHVAPLARFLRSHVGRPWDVVHGEIRAACRPRSTVTRHLYEHLWGLVARAEEVQYDGRGRVVSKAARSRERGCGPPFHRFYVCPRTDLLRETPRERT